MLTSTPALGNLGDQTVVTCLLAWHRLFLPKAYVCQLKAATSTAYMNLLGHFGSWRGLLSSLRWQNLQQDCQGWLRSSTRPCCWGCLIKVSGTTKFYQVWGTRCVLWGNIILKAAYFRGRNFSRAERCSCRLLAGKWAATSHLIKLGATCHEVPWWRGGKADIKGEDIMREKRLEN